MTAVTFLSKDENLTKSHIRFVEGRLLEEAKTAGRFTLDNSAASGSRLPEADRHDMEEFLEKIRQLLPVLGSELLTPVAAQQPPSSTGILRTEIKGLSATGQRTPTGFVVFKGSQAVLTPRPTASQYVPFIVATREAFTKDGTLVPEGDRLVFTRDVEFSSPSAAAAIVLSRAKRGPVVKPEPGKTKISIRLDNAVLEHFRNLVENAGGGNYQTLINDALLEHVHQRSTLDVVRQVVREELAPYRIARGSHSKLQRTRSARG